MRTIPEELDKFFTLTEQSFRPTLTESEKKNLAVWHLAMQHYSRASEVYDPRNRKKVTDEIEVKLLECSDGEGGEVMKLRDTLDGSEARYRFLSIRRDRKVFEIFDLIECAADRELPKAVEYLAALSAINLAPLLLDANPAITAARQVVDQLTATKSLCTQIRFGSARVRPAMDSDTGLCAFNVRITEICAQFGLTVVQPTSWLDKLRLAAGIIGNIGEAA